MTLNTHVKTCLTAEEQIVLPCFKEHFVSWRSRDLAQTVLQPRSGASQNHPQLSSLTSPSAWAVSFLAPTSALVLVPVQWRIPFFPHSPPCCCSTDCLKSIKSFSLLLCPGLQALSLQDTLRCSTSHIPPALDIKQMDISPLKLISYCQ